jgi:hypothetical protein
MSVATVKAHVTRLLAKLELDNRVQIALLAPTRARPDQRRRSVSPTATRPGVTTSA